MNLRMRLALRGDLRAAAEADIKAGRKAVTSVVRRKTNLAKRNIRQEITSSGLGQRLGNTIQGIAQPKRGDSFSPSGVVFSKALVKGKRGKPTDLVTVFSEGARIRPRGGKYLAIPARDVGGASSDRRRPAQPSDFPRGTFVFLPDPPRLVYARDPAVVVYWLVRQVRLRAHIDPESRFMRAMSNFEDLVVKAWDRNSQRAFDRLR